MLIPFRTTRRVAGGKSSPPSRRADDSLQHWHDGSYVVGILDGIVVGATALSKGLCIVDLSNAAEVVNMLREYLPPDVRALVREELLKED
jgi:hypothetical protein